MRLPVDPSVSAAKITRGLLYVEAAVEPGEIWGLIVKADDVLKYATEEKAGARREQAVKLLQDALREAEATGNAALVDQARTRLADLGAVGEVGP